MKIKWLLGATLATAALAAPAFGQIGVYIGTPPPPIRYEVRPPIPGPGYAGSTDIGSQMADTIAGLADVGIVPLMRVRTGLTPTMTTTRMAGICTKATGITTTTATITTGATAKLVLDRITKLRDPSTRRARSFYVRFDVERRPRCGF